MERNGIWSFIGRQMGVTAVRVHDFFHNSWQQQFFDSADFGKEQLKQLFLQSHDPSREVSQNIKAAIELFQKSHPEKRFCERKLYAMLYRFAVQCAAEFQKSQISIYDNLAF